MTAKSQIRNEIENSQNYRLRHLFSRRIYDEAGVYVGTLRGNGYFHSCGRWIKIGEVDVDLSSGDIARKNKFIEWCSANRLPVMKKIR